jgi:hypothetical protein
VAQRIRRIRSSHDAIAGIADRGQASNLDSRAHHLVTSDPARSIRIEYPGAFYHMMARGNRQEAIFRRDPDRELFLKTLGEACQKTGWQVHTYCLMSDSFSFGFTNRRDFPKKSGIRHQTMKARLLLGLVLSGLLCSCGSSSGGNQTAGPNSSHRTGPTPMTAHASTHRR